MNRFFKFFAIIGLAFGLSFGEASAQSTPNWTYGFVPTPAEWNNQWASKQDYLGSSPCVVNGCTLNGPLITAASTASAAGLNVPPGVAPTSPNNGDLWITASGFFARVNGTTVALTGAGSGSFTASNPLAVSFPSVGIVNYALNLNTSLVIDGSNNLGINLAHSNTFTASQSFSGGITVTTSFTATGLVTNADLVNASTTVNGQTCTLGSTCTITASAGTITFGSTTVAGGAGIMYNSTSGGTLTAIALGNNEILATNGSAVPALTATLPSAVQSNITATGTLTGGSTGAGFTVALGTSTITGQLSPANGGTGSNNGSFTISLGGNLVTAGALTQAGAFATTITATATTNSTLPAGTHTLAGLDVAQTFSALQTFTAGIVSNTAALGGCSIGSNALCATGTASIAGATAITSNNASALTVGANGATNAALQVDASTASSATGLAVKSAAAGSGVSLTAISSATNDAVIINGKGTGSVTIGSVSTGGVSLGSGGGGVNIGSAITYGGVTLANSVTGTGSMVLSSSPSIASLTVTTAFTATGLVTYADMASAAVASCSQYFAATASTLAAPANVFCAEYAAAFGTTTTFNFGNGGNQSVTLTGNISTMTVTGAIAGLAGSIRFIQDTSGSRTTVWNSIFKFAGGVTPSLSTAANTIDVLFYSCVSSSLCYASLVQNMK